MRVISHKSIRMMGCECVANKVCEKRSEETSFGTRYKCTWNEAVQTHNREVKRERRVGDNSGTVKARRSIK